MPGADGKLPAMRARTPSLAADAARIYLAQRMLGCDVTRCDGFSLARNPATPLIYDSHFAFDVAGELAEDGAAFEAALDQAFAGAGHRKVVWHASDPPSVEARLAAHDFEVEQVLQMVLEGPLARAPRAGAPWRLHQATSEDDWAALVRLQRANFDERNARNGQPLYEPAVAEQLVASWRMKPGMRFWLATLAGRELDTETSGEPCAYLGSWAGQDGLGMVEYLFTDPVARHRGIATALIAHAVEAVRSEGAEAVLIGADIEETPKSMYLGLGFSPVCLTRQWLRLVG